MERTPITLRSVEFTPQGGLTGAKGDVITFKSSDDFIPGRSVLTVSQGETPARSKTNLRINIPQYSDKSEAQDGSGYSVDRINRASLTLDYDIEATPYERAVLARMVLESLVTDEVLTDDLAAQAFIHSMTHLGILPW